MDNCGVGVADGLDDTDFWLWRMKFHVIPRERSDRGNPLFWGCGLPEGELAGGQERPPWGATSVRAGSQ